MTYEVGSEGVLHDPECLIVGAKVNGGVMLLASTDLGPVHMQALVNYHRSRYGEILLRTSASVAGVQIGAIMASYVMASGATYADALRNLMEHWHPDQPQPELGRGLLSIQSGAER